MKWLPIESAPRDGTRVLLWSPEWKHEPVCVGAYESYWDGWAGDDIAIMQPDPTHWMPLPEPPTAELERAP